MILAPPPSRMTGDLWVSWWRSLSAEERKARREQGAQRKRSWIAARANVLFGLLENPLTNIIYDGDRWERVTDERAKKLVEVGAITRCTGSCVAHCKAGASKSRGDTMFHVMTTWKHIEEIR